MEKISSGNLLQFTRTKMVLVSSFVAFGCMMYFVTDWLLKSKDKRKNDRSKTDLASQKRKPRSDMKGKFYYLCHLFSLGSYFDDVERF